MSLVVRLGEGLRRREFNDSKKRANVMFANLKFKTALIGVVCIAAASMTDSAFAVSVKIAKKCEALTAQAFPPREIGNPAAGSAKGAGRKERAYYRECVVNKGRMPAPAK
jgi:hypothetical protein